jgi:uncharacterized membrane protein YgaE (UPF0421/DUF939 family)
MQFAVKTALSIVIVYLVSFWQGWQSPSTSAITIALIASVDSIGDSLIKGALRVIGTVAGAAFGLWLIALFPQERMLYLLAASVGVTFFFYLARIYRGDTTIFFLTGMTMLLVFQDNNAQDAFLYGVNRTYMTLLGITVYTLVGVLLWPVNIDQRANLAAAELSDIQKALFETANAQEKSVTHISQLIQKEQRLRGFTYHTMEMDLSRKQWLTIVETYRKIDEALLLYLNNLSELDKIDPAGYMESYGSLFAETERMLQQIPHAWKSQDKSIEIPDRFEVTYKHDLLSTLPVLTSVHVISTIQQLSKLHEKLRELAIEVESINSAKPTSFKLAKQIADPYFNWTDPEAIKGSIVTFLVFWASVTCWIIFNPPLGYYLVIMATSFSFLTAFTPLKPSLLMILYTVSFFFATLSYIFILPNLTEAWGLGLYLFIYGFVSFYFIDIKASIFFIIGLSTLNITNQMGYAFDIFLMILLFFYLFLLLLMLFYYIPFSTRPEHLYRVLHRRLFGSFSDYIKRKKNLSRRERMQLRGTLDKMQLWASQIDQNYFGMDKQALQGFIKSCRRSTYLLVMYLSKYSEGKDNRLFQRFGDLSEAYFMQLLEALQKNREPESKEAFEKVFEAKLQYDLEQIPTSQYEEKDIIIFAEYISLQKSLWSAMYTALLQLNQLDINQLKESRF